MFHSAKKWKRTLAYIVVGEAVALPAWFLFHDFSRSLTAQCSVTTASRPQCLFAADSWGERCGGDTSGALISLDVTTESGLQYEDVRTGTGEAPSAGQTVVVEYTGAQKDGTPFDSRLDPGEPLEFVLGDDSMIPGFEQGVAGMRVGGRRKLTIPPHLAYGDHGDVAPGGPLPPGETLTFDVELLDVRP